MVTLTWLRGLLAHRRGRILATALGVAVGVALLASIGTFLSASTSKMTSRAGAAVAVDWQVQAVKGADPATLLRQVKGFGAVTAALPVSIADTTGLQSTSAGQHPADRPGQGRRPPELLHPHVPGRAADAVGLRQRRAAGAADGGEPARQARRSGQHRPRGPARREGDRRRRRRPAAGRLVLSAGRRARRRTAASATGQRHPAAPIDLHAHRGAGRQAAPRSRRHADPRRAVTHAARIAEHRVHTGLRACEEPRDNARRHGRCGRQPRHRAGPGAQGRAVRPAAVPVPRRSRRDPRRARHRLDRLRRSRPAPPRRRPAAHPRRVHAPARHDRARRDHARRRRRRRPRARRSAGHRLDDVRNDELRRLDGGRAAVGGWRRADGAPDRRCVDRAARLA